MAATAGGSLIGVADLAQSRDGPLLAGLGESRAPAPEGSLTLHAEDSLSEILAASTGLRERTRALQRAGADRRLSTRTATPRAGDKAGRVPLWAPTGKVASLGPARRRRPGPRADPRKAARVRARHEWYMQQALLRGRVDPGAKQLKEMQLVDRAARCLEKTEVKRRVAQSIDLFEKQRAAKAASLHHDWASTVYEPTMHRLRTAVDGAKQRPAQRRSAYDAFLAFSATASRLYLDDAGERKGDYDPLELNRASLRVPGASVARDPLKRSVIKAGAEASIMLEGGGSAEASRAIRAKASRTELGAPRAWLQHVAQPRRLVQGASNAPSRVRQDHYTVRNDNGLADEDFPAPAKRVAAQPFRNLVAHDVEPVFGPADDDYVDVGTLPEAAVRRCN